MELLFGEIRAAINGGLWVMALMSTLAVPDICAALGSPDGETKGAKGAKYRAWWEANLAAKYPRTDAGEFYKLRCSMLHQGGTATPAYARTVFVAARPHIVHNCWADNDGMNSLILDLPTLASDVIAAAQKWLAANKDSEPVKTNLTKLIAWHPNGLAPFEDFPALA